MKIPAITITPTILKSVSEIAVLARLTHSIDLTYDIARHIEEKSVLNSALYSARIEGNHLDESTLDSDDARAKTEVFNVVDAIAYLRSMPERQALTRDELLRLHAIVMKGLSSDAGRLRHSQNAIFDHAGAVRYLPPPPAAMRQDLDTLLVYANAPAEFPLITSLIVHLVFEKIHPFIDGNGRVGRLLIPFIQKTHGEQFPFFVPFEKFLEKNRTAYYRHLDQGMGAPEEYVVFMLYGLQQEMQKLYEEIERESKNNDTSVFTLTERQKEIWSIIQDHPSTTIDMLQRRFIRVPVRSLRHDVSVLQRRKLIEKIGSTRGACYRALKR